MSEVLQTVMWVRSDWKEAFLDLEQGPAGAETAGRTAFDCDVPFRILFRMETPRSHLTHWFSWSYMRHLTASSSIQTCALSLFFLHSAPWASVSRTWPHSVACWNWDLLRTFNSCGDMAWVMIRRHTERGSRQLWL